jgi:signal transduction histidine kinase
VEGTDGRLWFSVNNAVVWIDPDHASPVATPAHVSIQLVVADDKVYEPAPSMTLPAHTSNVQISFAAASLLHPDAIRFRYRLQGIDDEWHDAGRTMSVSYRSLPPGGYRFEVGATDTNGAWSKDIASAGITILPAFYQTGWFRALCGILLLALAWAAYRLRIRSLQRRFEMTLDARVAERTRIARELHDTLLQSFQSLLPRLQAVAELLPARVSDAKTVLLGTIDRASDAIKEGRQAVHDLRASASETNDLAAAIRTLGGTLSAEREGRAIDLRVEVQGTTRDLHPILRDEIFRIAGEALRNAFHHAGASRIEVEVRYDPRRFQLRVRDDGHGMDPKILADDGLKGHFGLRGMRERAKLIGGTLTIWSAKEAGTEVDLVIPASHAYIALPSRTREASTLKAHETDG